MSGFHFTLFALLLLALAGVPCFFAKPEEEKRAEHEEEEEKHEEQEEAKETAESVSMIDTHHLVFGVIVLIIAGVIAAFIAMVYAGRPVFAEKTAEAPTKVTPHTPPGEAIFAPPALTDAPAELRGAVTLGYHILMDTNRYAKDYVGSKNGLSCRNCHFEGGRTKDAICLVGVTAVYPKFVKRFNYPVGLDGRIGDCFERELNGKAPPTDSPAMQGLLTYFRWISEGIPIGADLPWLGLTPLTSAHKGDADAGRKLFTDRCTMCHGPEGQGSAMAPPLWGDRSFTAEADMNEPAKLAAFVHRTMPLGRADLTQEQALNDAAFLTSQPRPHRQSATTQKK